MLMWLRFDQKPNKLLLSSSSSLDSDLSSIVLDQDSTIPAMDGYIVFQVYRGLMCFVKGRSAKIYNTSTRQVVDLPDIEDLKHIPHEELEWKKSIMYNIGHDPVHNQYKVICRVSEPGIDMTEIWFLLPLGGDGSSRWRKISNPHSRTTRLSLCINGRIYYKALVRFSLIPVLVSIDVHSEEISIIQIPEYSKHADLIEFGGKVAFLDYIGLKYEGLMKLWVLEDADKNIWSKMKTLVLHSSQMGFFKDIRFNLEGSTRNGEVIFVSVSPPDKTIVKPDQSKTLAHVFIYNIQNNHLRTIEINQTSSYCTRFWNHIGFDDVDNLMYF